MGKNILLVDDQPVNLKLGSVLLTKLGYEVKTATDGQIAVDAYSSEVGGFDLILMDYQMPNMDGAEATKKIRELEAQGEGSKLPIVAMTAAGDDKQIEAALTEAGIDEIIAKPFKHQQVKDILKKYLGD